MFMAISRTRKLSPYQELSRADVLVLDCEGAKKSILSGLGTLPLTIVCELHLKKGPRSKRS
jgi:hypothetical protein